MGNAASSACQAAGPIGSNQVSLATDQSNAAMWVGPAQAQWRGRV